jgi:hypothetical protein
MRRFLILAALALLASPALAGNVQCTGPMVTGGFCPDTTHRLLFYPIPNTDPDGAGPKVGLAAELADAICDVDNYQPTLEDGAPNPETCVQFADRRVKEHLRDFLRRYREQAAEATKQATLDADPVPELP